MDDCDVWQTMPWARRWFDKLRLATRLGYACGPCGVAPTVSGRYVVRPIYNPSGMGAGAHVEHIQAGDSSKVPPGYFWCEYFVGRHISVSYAYGRQLHAYEGFNSPQNLSRFHRWVRTHDLVPLPPQLNSLRRAPALNVEYVGGHAIEVHLRPTPDPTEYAELIPVWADEWDYLTPPAAAGYQWIAAPDDADGFAPQQRLGFLVR